MNVYLHFFRKRAKQPFTVRDFNFLTNVNLKAVEGFRYPDFSPDISYNFANLLYSKCETSGLKG